MKYGVCLEMFFTDLPFPERILAAGQAGCRYAEMWFTDKTAWAGGQMKDDPKDAAKVRAAAEKAKVTLTNAVIGSPDGSMGGGLTNPAKRKEWLDRARMSIQFARGAGVGALIVCTGNVVSGMTEKQMQKSVEAGLKETVKLAEAAGITLFLEPLNTPYDHAGYWLASSDRGAEICRKISSPRLKLLFDCYHMQIMEGDLFGHIRRNLDVIGHIHSAGYPGRHELWLGETNYPFLARQVDALGYSGVFALEYLPTLDSAESLRKALAHLKGTLPNG